VNDISMEADLMHFTTLAGSVDYVGTQGGQILLSNGTIVDIIATDETVTFNVPSGKHIVKLVESVGRSSYVSAGGEALVELHNFPALSTVTRFDSATGKYNPLPNLTKVPNLLPSNITNMSGMFRKARSFNQPLNNWDVSGVTNMSGLNNMNGVFYNASAFNQDLSNWCVSNFPTMPADFNNGATFLVGAKLPRWGTCPAP
jgi:surface protein